ncbi:MAG TPA: aminotransferase class V-fold PLP-dependent enzyme [Gemmatimonadaceae bacterium]
MSDHHPHPVFALLEEDAERDAAHLFANLAADYLTDTRSGTGPVSTSLTPAEIAKRFAEPLPTGTRDLQAVAERVGRDVMGDINRLAHPMYLGHQVSAPLPAMIWMETVIAAMNQSVAVWEMSPTATIVETQLIRWLGDMVGWGAGVGGTFTSGGTEAIFTALLAARAAAMPEAWEEGVGDDPPVVVCGEHAHYAVTRAVAQLGMGVRRAIAVPSRDHRMDTDALDATLGELASSGTRVMAVVATAGSTATGSFDDIEAIGTICERRGIWFHVDGAHGASALLSPRHRHRMRGVERARSLTWDAHKMMLAPLSGGMLLVRDERDLEHAFAQAAPYLFHPSGNGTERSWDQGKRSFMCSRRTDALKVWVALQRYGADGIAAIYDHLCDTARALHEEIASRDDFEAMHEPQSNILCFRWIGDGSYDDATLDRLNRELRERYNRSGEGWITATVIEGRQVLRVTVMNPRSNREHARRLLHGLAELAAVKVAR